MYYFSYLGEDEQQQPDEKFVCIYISVIREIFKNKRN